VETDERKRPMSNSKFVNISSDDDPNVPLRDTQMERGSRVFRRNATRERSSLHWLALLAASLRSRPQCLDPQWERRGT